MIFQIENLIHSRDGYSSAARQLEVHQATLIPQAAMVMNLERRRHIRLAYIRQDSSRRLMSDVIYCVDERHPEIFPHTDIFVYFWRTLVATASSPTRVVRHRQSHRL